MLHRLSHSLVAFFALPLAPLFADSDDIHKAIEKGSLEQVKALIAKDPRLLESSDDTEFAPLHTAARENKEEIVKHLLELGANANAKSREGWTAIHLTEDPRIIKLLVKHKADMEAIAGNETPLQRATRRLLEGGWSEVEKRGWAMAEVLIELGAKYDIRSAVRLGDLDRVKSIVKTNREEAVNRAAMRDAAICGHADIVQFLLDNKGDPNDAGQDETPLLSCALRHPEVVRTLIKAGAEVKDPLKNRDRRKQYAGGQLLHRAAGFGAAESVKLLIEAGIDINSRDARGDTPIFYAAQWGRFDNVKALRQHKASIQGEIGAKAMRRAVESISYAEQKASKVEPYKSIVKYLIQEGVPADVRAAIVLGDLKLCKELLKQKPLPEKPPDYEKPLIHLSIALNQIEFVIALLDSGVSTEQIDDDGKRTPLHFAAVLGRTEIVELLVKRGVKLDARTKEGATPLIEAARCGYLPVARILLAAGCDLHAKDSDGKTALGNVPSEFPEMFEFIKKNGGKL